MAQGSRRGWVRTVFAGIGAVLCAGAIGCTDIDKPKDSKLFGNNSKQPAAGLPGTAKLPGSPGSGLNTTGMTNPGAGMGSGVQPGGGRGSTNTGFGTAGMSSGAGMGASGTSNLVPSVAPAGNSPAYTAGGGGYPSSAGSPPAPGLADPGLAPPYAPGSNAPVYPPSGAAGAGSNYR